MSHSLNLYSVILIISQLTWGENKGVEKIREKIRERHCFLVCPNGNDRGPGRNHGARRRCENIHGKVCKAL